MPVIPKGNNMKMFSKTNFNFMGYRYTAFIGSGLAILAGIISLVIKGGPAYNIDFTGGTEMEISFRNERNVAELRTVISALRLGSPEIKSAGSQKVFYIRFQEEGADINTQVMKALQKTYPDDQPEVLQTNLVGPRVGAELRESAVYAILVTLALLLVYIGIRFDLIFGVGAVIALFHDVLITLGLFSLFNIEVSLAVVAAFLTLIGYSLNDTIVVFDRIRENLRSHQKRQMPIEEVINTSINETLSRTVITGMTTLMVVVVYLIYGGDVLRDFFICLFIGILVGTYSSIFIASPIVADWYLHRKRTSGHTISVRMTGKPKAA